MIKISIKRITFVFALILISTFTYMGLNTGSKNSINVNASPVSGKTIVIDAGHGMPDGGSVGVNGTIESEINLKIAQKVQKLIEESGNNCIMTRLDENGISGLGDEATIRQKHVADLKNRVKIGNESSADIFVSIHLNKIAEEKYNGWQAFYKVENEESQNLAGCIQEAIQEVVRKRK